MDDIDADPEDVVLRWSELPEGVVALIQARLPLLSLVRSRAVCKAWNVAVELLRERLESISRVREHDCLLFLVGSMLDRSIASCVYDRASDRWYVLQLPPWLRELLEQDNRRTFLQLPRGSGGGGVLLFTATGHPEWKRKRSIMDIPHMGNPVSRSWTSLPALPGRPGDLCIQDVLGVFVDDKARCFKLVASGQQVSTRCSWRNDDSVPTYVFDSTLGSWNLTSSSLPSTRFRLSLREQEARLREGVFVGTMLYCAAGSRGALFAYDLERATWSWFAVATPHLLDFDCLSCNLINLRGRLLCVAVFRNIDARGRGRGRGRGRDPCPCVQIWELDFARMIWTVVETMPAPILTDFLRTYVGTLSSHCTGSHWKPYDAIDVVAGQDCQVYIMHHWLDKVVALDLGQTPAAWRWLPSCPYFDFVRKRPHCLDPWLEFGMRSQKQILS